MNGALAGQVLARSLCWGLGIGLATGMAAGAGVAVAVLAEADARAAPLLVLFPLYGASLGFAVALVPTTVGALVLAGVALGGPTPRQLHAAAWVVVAASLAAVSAFAVARGLAPLLLSLPVAIGMAVRATRSIAHSHSMVPGGFEVMS